MLCSRSCIRTIAVTADHTNAASTTRSFPHSLAVDFSSHPFPLIRTRRFRCPKSILISCNSSRTSRSSFPDHHNNDDFLEASLLLSETISHYHMWRQRFQPELQRKSRRPSIPLSVQEKTSRSYNNLSRQGFLQRFQNPTIFLKVSCDGDYILPIVVGKIAIEKLIGAEVEQESEDCPDQFQFVKDLVDRLDHEVIMVRITERVVSTYFAKLYISQPGESGIISLDARPSDAINVANRCKAPIYVSKQIVFTDAIRLGYGMGGVLKKKATYGATNILSLYHLSTTLQSPKSTKPPPSAPVPDQLLRQLHTIRATINQLTRLQPNSKKSTIPPDLLLYSHLSPIASSCHNHPDLLHKYMTYTAFSLCPSDSDLAESLILRGCHPLPRRRCFSRTPKKQQNSLPQNPFPSSLPDSAVIWDHYTCKSFDCLNRQNPNLGFDTSRDASKFTSYSDELDLPVQQLLQIAKSAKSVLRLGLDVGGGTGSFAAAMRLRNVTVLTTTMSVAAPYSEAVALRGLVPLHVPLQQRLPLFDGVVDVVRCGRAVNRWIPATMMEFLLFDLDRVLRGGGYLWLDHFFSKGVDLEKVYAPLIGKLGYKKVKWATGNKTDAGGVKHGEVYLTVLLQKPLSR